MSVKEDSESGGGQARSQQLERSEATRASLLATARGLFAERGYAEVGTEEIVRAAGVTRGALYHHFAGKLALFDAVYEQVERELTQATADAALAAGGDALNELQVGVQAFLSACEDPAVQRIALIDAPSVLGWERWREIGMEYGLGLMRGVLQGAMEAGLIIEGPVEPLAQMLLGAIDEGAMLIARSDDPAGMREQVSVSLGRFLDALRPPVGG